MVGHRVSLSVTVLGPRPLPQPDADEFRHLRVRGLRMFPPHPCSVHLDPGLVQLERYLQTTGSFVRFIRHASIVAVAAMPRHFPPRLSRKNSAPLRGVSLRNPPPTTRKLAERRQQCIVDIFALSKIVDHQGREEVARLLRLVEARGYSRGKSLEDELQSMMPGDD